MDGWVGLDLIRIIQFCLKIFFLWRQPLAMGGCVGGWMDGSVDEWVMCRHTPTHGWVDGWVGQWVGSLKI